MALTLMYGNRGLAVQATLQVEPANKLLSFLLRSILLEGSSLIECLDSEESSNLLTRQTYVLELLHIRQKGELLSKLHHFSPSSR